METYNNIRAFVISLFVRRRPISRRFDAWVYMRGKKISAYEVKACKSISDVIKEMEERKLVLPEDGIRNQNSTISHSS